MDNSLKQLNILDDFLHESIKACDKCQDCSLCHCDSICFFASECILPTLLKKDYFPFFRDPFDK
jgi:hypothetical protein